MKAKLIVWFLLVFSSLNLFASCDYNYRFTLLSDGDKIGVMTNICQVSNGIETYRNEIKIDTTFMFIKYQYSYFEKVSLKDNKILSLEIFENNDGEILKVNPQIKHNILFYENGNKVELKQIDYYPFIVNLNILSTYLENKIFKLKTFDLLNGELIEEKYQTIDTKKSYKFEVTINGTVEIREYDKNFKLLYLNNKLFETKKGE